MYNILGILFNFTCAMLLVFLAIVISIIMLDLALYVITFLIKTFCALINFFNRKRGK